MILKIKINKIKKNQTKTVKKKKKTIRQKVKKAKKRTLQKKVKEEKNKENTEKDKDKDEDKDKDKDELSGFNLNFNNKKNPLHGALEAMSEGSTTHSIKEIMKRAPKLVQETDETGATPLHVVTLGWNTSPTFLGLILNEDKAKKYIIKALHIIDNRGWTPFHNLLSLLKVQYSERKGENHPVLEAFEILRNKYFDSIETAESLDGTMKND